MLSASSPAKQLQTHFMLCTAVIALLQVASEVRRSARLDILHGPGLTGEQANQLFKQHARRPSSRCGTGDKVVEVLRDCPQSDLVELRVHVTGRCGRLWQASGTDYTKKMMGAAPSARMMSRSYLCRDVFRNIRTQMIDDTTVPESMGFVHRDAKKSRIHKAGNAVNNYEVCFYPTLHQTSQGLGAGVQ